MQETENKLDELLVKKAPFQLPANVKEGLVKALPWITLAGGILTALSVVFLFQALILVNSLFGGLAVVTGVAYPGLMFMAWVALAIAAVQAVMFFVAFGPLKDRKKSGWNILFWVSLVYAVYAVALFFGNWDVFSLILSLVGDVVGLYLLFQVRSYYVGGASVKTMDKAEEPKPKAK